MKASAVEFSAGMWLRRNAISVALLVGFSTALVVLPDWYQLPVVWLVLTLALGLSFLRTAWRLRDSRVPFAILIGVAVVLRVLALGLPLSLSDDAYRYIWDGRVAAAGFNPYELAPDAPSLTELRDDLWRQVAHRDVETVYPPVAIRAFSIASAAGRPVLAWKAILAAVDLLSCCLLISLARLYGVASGRVVGYLWNPLVTFEIAGMGHVDGLALLPLIAAAWWLSRGDRDRPRGGLESALSALALSIAVLIKLIPVLVLAAWARLSRRQSVFLATSAIVLLIGFLPVARASHGVPPGLLTYGISWEFNGPIFEPLWRLFELARIDDLSKAVLSWLTPILGTDRVEGLYGFLYPQLLAKAVLGLGLVAALVRSARRSDDVVASAFFVFAAFIAASATVYPWYLLWVLPWAALQGRRSWLVLTVSIQMAYLPRFFDLDFFPWIYLAVWVPFVVSFLIDERALQADTVVSG